MLSVNSCKIQTFESWLHFSREYFCQLPTGEAHTRLSTDITRRVISVDFYFKRHPNKCYVFINFGKIRTRNVSLADIFVNHRQVKRMVKWSITRRDDICQFLLRGTNRLISTLSFAKFEQSKLVNIFFHFRRPVDDDPPSPTIPCRNANVSSRRNDAKTIDTRARHEKGFSDDEK